METTKWAQTKEGIKIGDTVTYWSDIHPCAELTGIVEYDYKFNALIIENTGESKKICEDYGVASCIELTEIEPESIIKVVRG